MPEIVTFDENSRCFRVFLQSSTDGSAKTDLTFETAGLIISTIADNEAAPTIYKVDTDGNVETITTLGTYAAPTASKCRFKEVSKANHPGVYEIQLADARLAVASAKSLLITVTGTGLQPCHKLIPLARFDLQAAEVTPTAASKTGYGLADDAITAAKFDESTAFPLKSADTGDTTVARKGSGTVTLTDISTAVVTGVPSTLQASANTETTGTLVSGTYASTYLSNGTSWVLAPVTPAVAESGTTLSPFGLNVNLLFTAGATQTVNSVSIRGNFAAGPGRYTNVYAYNWTSASWDMLSDIGTRMNNTATLTSYTYTLLASHQKPDAGGDGLGAIRIGFKSPSTNTGDRLNVDQCLVNVATANPSTADIADAVYAKFATNVYGRQVWIDTVDGVDGYVIGVNGLEHTPVLTIACAYQLCDDLGLKTIAFKSGSNAVVVELTRSAAGWRFYGPGKINLSDESIADAIFEECYSVYGGSTGDDATFNRCQIGSGGLTLDHSYVADCRIKGAITLIANAEPTIFQSCIDATGAGADFELIFVTNATAVVRNFQGGITLKSMATGNSIVIDGACRVTIDASCTGGTITLRGFADAPDGAAAFVAAGGTITQTARYATDQITTAASAATPTVTLADGAITDAKLAGGLEKVFETDFGTAYNATNKAWVTKLGNFAQGGAAAGLTLSSVSIGNDLDIGGSVNIIGSPLSVILANADHGGAAATLTLAAPLATAAELAKVPKSDGAVIWNDTALASIQSEANDALTAFTGDTGITLPKALEMLAAFLAGKVTATSDGTTTTYTYKKRDGSTTSFTQFCTESDGLRANTGNIS